MYLHRWGNNSTGIEEPKSGFDSKRLEMLLAIISKKLGIKVEEFDIYLNITGGIKVNDRGIDLAVIQAILSSLKSKKSPELLCYLGEVGLTGRVRETKSEQKKRDIALNCGFSRVVSSQSIKTINEI